MLLKYTAKQQKPFIIMARRWVAKGVSIRILLFANRLCNRPFCELPWLRLPSPLSPLPAPPHPLAKCTVPGAPSEIAFYSINISQLFAWSRPQLHPETEHNIKTKTFCSHILLNYSLPELDFCFQFQLKKKKKRRKLGPHPAPAIFIVR